MNPCCLLPAIQSLSQAADALRRARSFHPERMQALLLAQAHWRHRRLAVGASSTDCLVPPPLPDRRD